MDFTELFKPLKFNFPLQYDRTITDFSNYTNVMLIDKNVSQSNIFYKSCNSTTFPVMYNYFSSSSNIIELLSKFNSNIRLAFVFEHTIGSVNLLFDMKPIFNDSLDNTNVSIILEIIKNNNIIHIDYLACNTMNDIIWKPYYDLLHSHHIVIGCSSDFTGNLVGSNWIMESTKENIKNIYFTDNINNYTSNLGTTSINGNEFNLDISNSYITLKNGPDNVLQYNTNTDSTFYDISQNIMLIDCSLNLAEDIDISNNYCFGIRDNVHFDGNYNTIKFNSIDEFNGLFDMSDSSMNVLTINNLTFENNDTNLLFGASVLVQQQAQGNIEITDCIYNGDISGFANSGFVGAFAGGVADEEGENVDTIRICTIKFINCTIGNVSGDNTESGGGVNSGFVGVYAGGRGKCTVTFDNCHTGNVNGSLNSGFIGLFAGAGLGGNGSCIATFTNCYTGNINDTGNSGFIGVFAGAGLGGNGYCIDTFTNCYTGNINDTGNSGFIGALAGAGPALAGPGGNGSCITYFTNCYTGTINDTYNSGFVGVFQETPGQSFNKGTCNAYLTNCYTGNFNIDGSCNPFIGDATDCSGSITNCYTIGSDYGNVSYLDVSGVGFSPIWNDISANIFLINDFDTLLSQVPADIYNDIYDISGIICPIPNTYLSFGIWTNISDKPWLLNSFNFVQYTYNNMTDKYPEFTTSSDNISISVVSNIFYSSFTVIELNNDNMIYNYNYYPFDITHFSNDINLYLVIASTDISNTQYSINLLTITKTTNVNNNLFRVLWIKNDNGLNISFAGSKYKKIISPIQHIIDSNSNMNQLVCQDLLGNNRLILL